MNGFIVIDKPAGITSAKAVACVKRQLPKGTKIGHTGTLDPNVTGVLPLAIGKATRSISYLKNETKSYQCTLLFGVQTDSADRWGRVLDTRHVAAFTSGEIAGVLRDLSGVLQQIPPMYSALKKDGKRLYELARQGKVVERPARPITIFGYSDIEYDHPYLSFSVECSRGTYIRTLCEDIAKALGTLGTMYALRRTMSGPFSIEQAVLLDAIDPRDLRLLPSDILFEDWPIIDVDRAHALHLLHGVKVNLARFTGRAMTDSHYRVYCGNDFIGIASKQDNRITFIKSFCDQRDLGSEDANY